MNGSLMFSHMLVKVYNLFPGQRPEVALREQQPCRIDKAYKWLVYQQGEKRVWK